MTSDRTVDAEISALGSKGDGITCLDGGMLYVPYAAPGDKVRIRLAAKKSVRPHGDIVDIIRPSPDRQPPVCPYFTQCGGCSIQHLTSHVYEVWKRQLVCAALSHRGLEPSVVLPLVSGGLGRRRRTRLKARKTAKALLLGFRAPRSHLIVPVDECAVLAPGIVALFDGLRQVLDVVLRQGDEAEVAVTLCSTGLDVTIAGPTNPDLAIRELLVQFAESQDIARVNWRKLHRGRPGEAETVIRRRAPELHISGLSVEPPPDGFVQPTLEGESALRDGVVEALGGAGRVADLYAGCGAFALALAVSSCHVVAADSDAHQMQALTEAASRGGVGSRITPETRDLNRRPLVGDELRRLDGLVLDPPRAGALSQVKAITETPVPRVAYVSCNPASFARDARALVDARYRLESVLPVDQFLFTSHVELLGVFSRMA